jgi:hypothetical protein
VFRLVTARSIRSGMGWHACLMIKKVKEPGGFMLIAARPARAPRAGQVRHPPYFIVCFCCNASGVTSTTPSLVR